MTTPCAVSVVMPTYNGGPLLGEQLACLAAQDFDGPWEVVLADNGSTDGSLDQVAGLARSLTIRVIDASGRRGPSYARNAGVAAARGEYVALCDADDLLAPRWLSALYAARDSADIVAGHYDVVSLNDPHDVAARGGAEQWSGLLRGPAGFLPFAGSANLLMRRQKFLDVGGFDETIPGPGAEDVDLSWRVQLGGGTITFAPEATMHYRFRSRARDAYRQSRAYKTAEAELYVRYHAAGMADDPEGYLASRVRWLVTRLPYPALGRRRRVLWCTIAGEVAGIRAGRPRRNAITKTPSNAAPPAAAALEKYVPKT
jgi:glycosyltransferase involved in cell wall biosynthesis